MISADLPPSHCCGRPKISFFGFPAAGIELGHGRFISMQRAAFQQMLNQRSTKGCSATPVRPTHSAIVERARMTPSRAAICSDGKAGDY